MSEYPNIQPYNLVVKFHLGLAGSVIDIGNSEALSTFKHCMVSVEFLRHTSHKPR